MPRTLTPSRERGGYRFWGRDSFAGLSLLASVQDTKLLASSVSARRLRSQRNRAKEDPKEHLDRRLPCVWLLFARQLPAMLGLSLGRVRRAAEAGVSSTMTDEDIEPALVQSTCGLAFARGTGLVSEGAPLRQLPSR